MPLSLLLKMLNWLKFDILPIIKIIFMTSFISMMPVVLYSQTNLQSSNKCDKKITVENK